MASRKSRSAFDGPLVGVGAGSPRVGWMTAVGNMFRKIGLTYRLRGNLQFNEFLSKRDAKEMTRLARDLATLENVFE